MANAWYHYCTKRQKGKKRNLSISPMPCWQYLLEDPSGLTNFVKLGHYCQFFAIKNKFVMNKHFHYTVLEGISQPTKNSTKLETF